MWQRVGRRTGWGQGEKGSPRQERESHQHISQPWLCGSCQPCALCRSLHSPRFARQRPRTEAAPVVPAEGPAHLSTGPP